MSSVSSLSDRSKLAASPWHRGNNRIIRHSLGEDRSTHGQEHFSCREDPCLVSSTHVAAPNICNSSSGAFNSLFYLHVHHAQGAHSYLQTKHPDTWIRTTIKTGQQRVVAIFLPPSLLVYLRMPSLCLQPALWSGSWSIYKLKTPLLEVANINKW